MVVGVSSDVPIICVPLPKSMSYTLAFPAEVISKVTVNGEPPELTSAVKSTSVTAVFFIILNANSFSPSTLSTILVVELIVLSAPPEV